MTIEEAKTEIMQIYGSLSEEKKMALDVLMAQADGDLINKNNAITSVCQWGTTLERTGTYTITVAEMKQTITDMLCELPTVDIPPEHDGCKDCKHELKSAGEYPCSYCKQNYKDMWEYNHLIKIER